MSRKYFLISSFLVISLLPGVSAADDTTTDGASTYCKAGFYAGVQGGHGNTSYQSKDLLPPIENSIRGRHATYPGINVYNFEENSFTFNQSSSSGSAGRIYAGYQFDPYFSMEAGYTQFNKIDFNAQNTISEVNINVGKDVYHDQYNGEVTEHAFDFTGKFTLPLNYGFGLYAKAGAAYISAQRHINDTFTGVTILNDGRISPIGVKLHSQNTIAKLSSQAVRGVWGGGLDYTIPNTNFDVDISYTQILGGGTIPKATLEALGVNYKFA